VRGIFLSDRKTAEYFFGPVRVFHQRRSRFLSRYFSNGTAAIDIQNVEAERLKNGCGACHGVGIASDDLTACRVIVGSALEKIPGFDMPADECFGRDHLRECETKAMIPRNHPEGEIGTPRHRGLNNAGGEL